MLLLRGDLNAIASELKKRHLDGAWNVLVSTERRAGRLALLISKKNRERTRSGRIVIVKGKSTLHVSHRLDLLPESVPFLALDVDVVEIADVSEWPDVEVLYCFCVLSDDAPLVKSKPKKEARTLRQSCIRLIPGVAFVICALFVWSVLYLRIENKKGK